MFYLWPENGPAYGAAWHSNSGRTGSPPGQDDHADREYGYPQRNKTATAPPTFVADSVVAVSLTTREAIRTEPPYLGNSKWLTVACKFADNPSEPQPISFFTDMYRNSFPGWITISVKHRMTR
ncbi:MAG: hypothetical protein R3C44_24390 [Chloroflexota bacterium]